MLQVTPVLMSPENSEALAGYLLEKFDDAVKARNNQVDTNYKRWIENYNAKPRVATRTTPFYNASNFVPQLIRMDTDIMHARILGLMFAPKPFWRPRTFLGDEVASAKSLAALANWYEALAFNSTRLFEPLDLVLHTTTKVGTGILKAPWVQKDFWLGGAIEGGREGKRVVQEGLVVSQVDFDDFWVYPITAQSCNEALILFHRIRLTKEEVEYRLASSLYGWDKAAGEALLTTPRDPSEEPARASEARSAGIQLSSDVNRPFNVVEAWLQYPTTNDKSKQYKLITTFNPYGRGKTALLRSLYNYYSRGIHPFVDYRLNHRAGLFHGVGFAELLEQAQEEQAQIHNARRDGNTISNVPGWKKKKYASIPDPSAEWYPGKVFELESMDDLEPLVFPREYNSMLDEERYLLELAEGYTGVSGPMQGAGAGGLQGKRGIYSSMGTLAVMAEGNRRLDVYLKRLRFPSHALGNIIFQSYRDFRPAGPELEFMGEQGALVKQLFKLQEPADFPYLFFDIGASDASANKETDRSALLLMANTMASYYRQVVEAAQIITQLPDPNHPFAKIMLAVLDGARSLADRLLQSFDIGDRDKLAVDVRQLLGGSSQQGAESADQRGMPEAEGALSLGGLRDISSRLAILQGKGTQGA